MKTLIRYAAVWWLALAAIFVFLFGLAELIVQFPPHAHRLAYAAGCLASLLSVVEWIETVPATAAGARR